MSEILGSLFKYAVQLLGVAAVVAVLYQVFFADKTGRSIEELTQLQTNIQGVYSTQNSFATLTTARVINGGMAPDKMINGAALTNPWGGVVTPVVNAGNPAQFDISETLVPQDSCARMAISQSAAINLTINAVAQALPLDAGLAVDACNAANNTLVFTFTH